MQVRQPDTHNFVYDTDDAIHCKKVTYITAVHTLSIVQILMAQQCYASK